ncbi:uncharacterized protein LOC143024375 [Oratosquilla oratoria]|uniref:uncharacterized protein LOC143024375 n=1 Tax=Oratosquilla oratoria TaxID=337810 RepID=UPI003F76F75F
METLRVFALLTLLASIYVNDVESHGRMMEPAARNCLWRYGFPNPINYNDNELYCGGFVVQYKLNKGKCGVCGDDFRETVPRSHEAGGVYANGIISKRYVAGQVIDIHSDLTANHRGYFEVKLCPNNNPNEIVTQECFDQYTLELADEPGNTKFIIPEDSKKTEYFIHKVKLPDGVTCTQCVLQWKYFAGNTWGSCTDGSTSVGCGNQETFINCADIAINTNAGLAASNVNALNNQWLLYFRGSFPGGSTIPTHSLSNPNDLKPLVVRSQLCIPMGQYKNVPFMKDWCRTNCLKYPPNCHPKVCKCVMECEAVGEFALQRDADVYCHQNCLKFNSKCPEDRCRCF